MDIRCEDCRFPCPKNPRYNQGAPAWFGNNPNMQGFGSPYPTFPRGNETGNEEPGHNGPAREEPNPETGPRFRDAGTYRRPYQTQPYAPEANRPNCWQEPCRPGPCPPGPWCPPEKPKDCIKEILCSTAQVANVEADLFKDVLQRLMSELCKAHEPQELQFVMELINNFLQASALKERAIAKFLYNPTMPPSYTPTVYGRARIQPPAIPAPAPVMTPPVKE